jgi:hypothetical protein
VTSLLTLPLVGSPLFSTLAQAEEPKTPREPTVMNETAVDLLELASAFDVGDMFDASISLSFDHQSRQAAIRRETNIAQPGLTTGGYTSDHLEVATFHESSQRLIPQIDIGLFRDIQLSVRMPVILAYNQKLTAPDGSAGQTAATAGLVGEQLFSPSFQSPTRSGIEYLAVGLDVGLMNQFRNPARPNWNMGIEGRFNVSEPMHACNENPKDGQVKCAHDADRNRNGQADNFDGSEWGPLEGQSEGDFSGEQSPGVSRGTTGIEAHAYVSKRLKYIEPYTGVSALFEFQGKDTAYGAFDVEGVLVNHPPIRGTVIAGVAIVPWEQAELYRRFVVDIRVRGTYVSEGRDYSELFDALGSSDARSLRNPNFSAYTFNDSNNLAEVANAPSVVDPTSPRVNFTGLTDVQQHGDYEVKTQLTWQAGKYVKFDLGAGWRIIQEHFITFDKACTADVTQQVVRSGPCKINDTTQAEADAGQIAWKSGGLPNPHQRKVINDPGQRFKVEASQGFRTWVRASVLF